MSNEQKVEVEPAMEVTITPATAGNFKGFDVKVTDSTGNAYSLQMVNLAAQMSLAEIKETSTPSKYIKELRSALATFNNLIISQKIQTLKEEWNLAVRDGKNKLVLATYANGYLDKIGFHPYEQAMDQYTNKYPVELLLFGLSRYQDRQDRPTKGSKIIGVKASEIERYNFEPLLTTMTKCLQHQFGDHTLRLTVDFEMVCFDEDSGVDMGSWTITLHWNF
jgi:hypothetical protein